MTPRLYDYFPEQARSLLRVSGRELFTRLGLGAIIDVVADVLCGLNVRSATETLTRRRLALLSAGLVVAYLKAAEESPGLAATIPARARSEYATANSEEEKQFLRWTLGLTTKQVQNVLRSDASAWEEYVSMYGETITESAKTATDAYGTLQDLELLRETRDVLDWPLVLHMLTAVGAKTLAVRGSEKSLYGKFFEKLILVGALHILGFTLVEKEQVEERSFWLSSRGERRESDATLLYDLGQGVRFDIGFIGPGNTEISLDKVSRFEREAEFGNHRVYLRTIILVDRIGARSRITDLAEAIDGVVLQMSLAYWPRQLGFELEAVFEGYESPLRNLEGESLESAIRTGAAGAPYDRALRLVAENGNGGLVEDEE